MRQNHVLEKYAQLILIEDVIVVHIKGAKELVHNQVQLIFCDFFVHN